MGNVHSLGLSRAGRRFPTADRQYLAVLQELHLLVEGLVERAELSRFLSFDQIVGYTLALTLGHRGDVFDVHDLVIF